MRNIFEKNPISPQEANPETNVNDKESLTGQKQEFREMIEKIKKNDIIVGEWHADLAKDLLQRAGINFDIKRLAEEKQSPNSEAILLGEVIFRLDKNDDESADKAFAILREQKLECHIVKDVIDLDKNKSDFKEEKTEN
jgi:hypothetical protein